MSTRTSPSERANDAATDTPGRGQKRAYRSPVSRKAAPKTTRYTTAWAAAELGVNERTVRRYIAQGHLDCDVLPGGHYRITEEHVRECRERARESKHALRRRAERRPPGEAIPSATSRGRRRRVPLGQEAPASAVDLSPGALASLRARYATG